MSARGIFLLGAFASSVVAEFVGEDPAIADMGLVVVVVLDGAQAPGRFAASVCVEIDGALRALTKNQQHCKIWSGLSPSKQS